MILDEIVDKNKEKLIEATTKILKIKSVEGTPENGCPYGKGPKEALDCALDIAKSLGFNTCNIDNYVGYAEYGQGDDYVGVLGHLDVVPEGDGWKYPPYAAEIHDGRIYARGSMDDKGPIMSALFGLKAIKESGKKLSKRVRIIFGTNEETGSKEIAYYLKKEKPPVSGFTPDGMYPIIYAEKGAATFNIVKDLKVRPDDNRIISINGGHRSNIVPDYCEAVIKSSNAESVIKSAREFGTRMGYDIGALNKDGYVLVTSVGIAAHGSTPQKGKNAIMQIFAFLETLETGKSDIYDFISFMNKHVGMEVYGKSFGVGLEDKESGKLSFNIGIINMNEEKITMTLNLRFPVTYKFDDMIEPFKKTIEGTNIRIENMRYHESLLFPKEHPLIKTLQKVYESETGKKADLLAIGGGTYAKEMPNIVAFGPIFPGKPDLDHESNENVEVDDLVKNAKIYAHAIYELAK